uniref:Uncharacterized protein n=1 Tax=Cucumis melo TaxID=3656 RepID=A0A9I9EES5_CUCME
MEGGIPLPLRVHNSSQQACEPPHLQTHAPPFQRQKEDNVDAYDSSFLMDFMEGEKRPPLQ